MISAAPSVSILLPTLQERDHIQGCLDPLLVQDDGRVASTSASKEPSVHAGSAYPSASVALTSVANPPVDLDGEFADGNTGRRHDDRWGVGVPVRVDTEDDVDDFCESCPCLRHT